MNKAIQAILFVLLIASCVPNKRIIYMQDLGDTFPVYEPGVLVENTAEEYLLQYNDVVDINVKTTSEELNAIFGIAAGEGGRMQMGAQQNINVGGDLFFMTGYTVDEYGKVELPLVGEVSILGLTTRQAKELIEEKMLEYVNKEDLYVRVRLGGIRFTTLGEFHRNGNHTILQNRINIFQAIAHAGDMTPVAKRNELVLVRQYPSGTRSFRINLNDKRLVESEFFFLRPNDMLYAEPMKVRELGTGVNFVQTFQLAVTTISAVLLVLNAIN